MAVTLPGKCRDVLPGTLTAGSGLGAYSQKDVAPGVGSKTKAEGSHSQRGRAWDWGHPWGQGSSAEPGMGVGLPTMAVSGCLWGHVLSQAQPGCTPLENGPLPRAGTCVAP